MLLGSFQYGSQYVQLSLAKLEALSLLGLGGLLGVKLHEKGGYGSDEVREYAHGVEHEDEADDTATGGNGVDLTRYRRYCGGRPPKRVSEVLYLAS